MAKYSPEFKQHIVNEYLKGNLGNTSLLKNYGIPDKKIYTWVRKYKQGGLEPKEKQKYSGEFKLNV